MAIRAPDGANNTERGREPLHQLFLVLSLSLSHLSEFFQIERAAASYNLRQGSLRAFLFKRPLVPPFAQNRVFCFKYFVIPVSFERACAVKKFTVCIICIIVILATNACGATKGNP